MTSLNDIIIAAVFATPPTLVATAGLIKSLQNGRQLKKIEVNVNGKLSSLLEATRLGARAEGVVEGGDAARETAREAMAVAAVVAAVLSGSKENLEEAVQHVLVDNPPDSPANVTVAVPQENV